MVIRNSALFIFFLFTCFFVKADFWESPSQKSFYSADSTYKVVISPFEQLTKKQIKKEKGNKKYQNGIIPTKIEFFKCINDGFASKIWERSLTKNLLPIDAMITNDGQYVITFDNWGHKGIGDYVVVIFDQEGNILRNYSLENLFGQEKNQFQKTSSSIIWKKDVNLLNHELKIYSLTGSIVTIQLDSLHRLIR